MSKDRSEDWGRPERRETGLVRFRVTPKAGQGAPVGETFDRHDSCAADRPGWVCPGCMGTLFEGNELAGERPYGCIRQLLKDGKLEKVGRKVTKKYAE